MCYDAVIIAPAHACAGPSSPTIDHHPAQTDFTAENKTVDTFSIPLAMNAWREILARIFDGFKAQDNVSPEWLINPATRRRLKLDRLYPDAGVAIRFAGLTAKGQRPSDWDIMENEQRDQTRAELCRINGVQLAVINPADDPLKQMDTLLRILSRASRVLAQGPRSDRDKKRWMPELSEARMRGSELRTLISKSPDQMMANLGEAWRDRETQMTVGGRPGNGAAVPAPPVKVSIGSAGGFSTGQRVRHNHFGDGVITDVTDTSDDKQISVLFDAAEERTFLLSLVADKLEAIAD